MRLKNKLLNLPIDLEHQKIERENDSLEAIVFDEHKFACDDVAVISDSATNIECVSTEAQSKAAFLTFLKESRLKNKQTKSVEFLDNVPMTTTSSIKINESINKNDILIVEVETNNDGKFLLFLIYNTLIKILFRNNNLSQTDISLNIDGMENDDEEEPLSIECLDCCSADEKVFTKKNDIEIKQAACRLPLEEFFELQCNANTW